MAAFLHLRAGVKGHSHVCLSELDCILQEALPYVVVALGPIEIPCDIWRSRLLGASVTQVDRAGGNPWGDPTPVLTSGCPAPGNPPSCSALYLKGGWHPLLLRAPHYELGGVCLFIGSFKVSSLLCSGISWLERSSLSLHSSYPPPSPSLSISLHLSLPFSSFLLCPSNPLVIVQLLSRV